MPYEAELIFLIKILKKFYLQVLVTEPQELEGNQVDFGLRESLGIEKTLWQSIQTERWSEPNTIYKLTDDYFCNYVFFYLPGSNVPRVLLIGPFLTFHMTKEKLMELTERLHIPPSQLSQLELYYGNVPVITQETVLVTLLGSFGEILWGDAGAFTMTDITAEMENEGQFSSEGKETVAAEESMLKMQMMEQRYAFENELILMVSRGLSQRAAQMIMGLQECALEQRVSDPLRNGKNYGIICNTLMRKAAENGGVHPIYLDSTSSDFAKRIEKVRTQNAMQELMLEMVHTYCRLVRKHSMSNYSPPIRKAIISVDANLPGDLRLQTLAQAQNISASYLSARFKEETGETVTEHVNRKRMELAARLLRSSQLQVQTIAQHCGIHDVNYFSKMFKKHYGKTPKQFREEQSGN